MKSPVYFTNTNESYHGIMIHDFYSLLEDVPHFQYGIFEVIEENEDQPIVNYPEIDSKEPLLNGPIQLVLNFVNEDKKILVPAKLEDPTWKDIFNNINKTIKFNNLPTTYCLQNLEITGYTEEGFGYHVECLLF